MNPLQIGISGTRGIPNQYGGFEQFAQYLAVGLVEKGHAVSVYCSHTHPYQQDNWNGVQLIHCKDPENKYGAAGQFLYDRNCITDSRNRNFDILLHLGYTSDSVWYRRWPSQSVHIVNMDGMEWKRSKYNRLTRIFLKYAESLAARHADRLVADSAAIQQYLLNKYHKEAVFIPYGAEVYEHPATASLVQYSVLPGEYYLAIARMEPENNLEMIIQGFLAACTNLPLLIIGNTSTRHGNYLLSKYKDPRIHFIGGLFDETALNDLRYYCRQYFHGHSVGGTNPSLLEAMACGAAIAAHNNEFNKAVLATEADYFSTPGDITTMIENPALSGEPERRRTVNYEKIKTVYNHQRITNQYEQLMQEAVRQKKTGAYAG